MRARISDLLPYVALLVSLLCLVAARADLYWCQIEDNLNAMVQQEIEGKVCHLIQKDPPAEPPRQQNAIAEPPRQQNATTEPDAPKTPNEGSPQELQAVPRSWPSNQQQRDEVRQSILYSELRLEINKRDLIYERLNSGDLSSNPEVSNFYQRRLHNHQLNIKALRQEIARMQ